MRQENIVCFTVDDILHRAMRYFRRETVIAFHACRPFRRNFTGDKCFYAECMEKPGIQRPEGIDGKAAGDADDKISLFVERRRIRRALPEEDVVAPLYVVGYFLFIEIFFLADIGVFVTAAAEHVFVAVDIEHADWTEIVTGFALELPFINDFGGQNLIQVVVFFGQKAFCSFLAGQDAHTETTHQFRIRRHENILVQKHGKSQGHSLVFGDASLQDNVFADGPVADDPVEIIGHD